MNGMQGMMNGFGWGGMWIGWLFWLVILGVVIWAVVTLVNRTSGENRSNPPANRETPLEILKKRYARGEITKEEYREMKNNL